MSNDGILPNDSTEQLFSVGDIGIDQSKPKVTEPLQILNELADLP
jgi:hypothetical protein